MIITCPCGDKKFEVDGDLIPDTGRSLKCGFCDQTWFFKKNDKKKIKISDPEEDKNIDFTSNDIETETISSQKNILNEPIKVKSHKNKGTEIIKYKTKPGFTFGKLLSYILVLIITFVALIIIIDTFKQPLYSMYPKLELILFNLFETLTDINLFIKDLF